MRQSIKAMCSLLALATIASSTTSRAQEAEHVDKTRRSDQGMLVVRHDQPAIEVDSQDTPPAIPKPAPKQEDEPANAAADSEKVSGVRHDDADGTPTEVEPQPGPEARSYESVRRTIQGLRMLSSALYPFDRVVWNRTFVDWSVHGNHLWTYRRLDMTYQPPHYTVQKTRTNWTYHPTSAPKHSHNRDWTYHRR